MKDTHSTSISRGFSLIELLFVIAIISLLMSIIIAMLSDAQERAKEARFQSDVKNASIEIEFFHNQKGRYPLTADCTQPNSSSNLCLPKSDEDTIYIYTSGGENPSDPQEYILYASSGGTGAFYQVSNNSSNPEIAGNLETLTFVGEYNEGDECESSYQGGGCEIGGPPPETEYAAAVETAEWDSSSLAIVEDDNRAITNQDGDELIFSSTGFPTGSGVQIQQVRYFFEASALPSLGLHKDVLNYALRGFGNIALAATSEGRLHCHISTNGGASYDYINTTEALSLSDKTYLCEKSVTMTPSQAAGIRVKVIASVQNSTVRIDASHFEYEHIVTGGSQGGGGGAI